MNRERGFSLVELLVVLGVIGVLAGLAIAGAGMWARSDEDRLAQTLHSMLRAARTYATAQNRLCAVGYLEGPAVTDSLSGELVRPLVGAALLYQTPNDGYDFLPGTGVDGWQMFPAGLCVLPYRAPDYLDGPPVFDGATGMMPVVMFGEPERVPAHVFRNRGELASGGEKQRYPLWVGVVPDAAPSERLWEAPGRWSGQVRITEDAGMVSAWAAGEVLPDGADLGLVGRCVTIWKAGGRVATVELRERD